MEIGVAGAGRRSTVHAFHYSVSQVHGACALHASLQGLRLVMGCLERCGTAMVAWCAPGGCNNTGSALRMYILSCKHTCVGRHTHAHVRAPDTLACASPHIHTRPPLSVSALHFLNGIAA